MTPVVYAGVLICALDAPGSLPPATPSSAPAAMQLLLERCMAPPPAPASLDELINVRSGDSVQIPPPLLKCPWKQAFFVPDSRPSSERITWGLSFA